MAFVRRVETGHDEAGRAVFVSDGEPPKTAGGSGAGVSEVFSLDAPPTSAASGGDPPDPSFFLEPPPGGLTVRVIKLPPPEPDTDVEDQWLRVAIEDPEKPGWHTTATLDVEVILEGEIVLELDDGEHHLRAGDAVVQQGTAHRWRVVGDGPCTYLAMMLSPETDGEPDKLAARLGDSGIRRVVTGAGIDGPAPVALRTPGPSGITITDLWHTGGPLRSVDQGGDPDGPYELEPRNGGISVRLIEMPAGLDTGDAGWHVTDTIDVDVVLRGTIAMSLRDQEPVQLKAGDVVLQRATDHLWGPVGDEPFAMIGIMIGLRH